MTAHNIPTDEEPAELEAILDAPRPAPNPLVDLEVFGQAACDLAYDIERGKTITAIGEQLAAAGRLIEADEANPNETEHRSTRDQRAALAAILETVGDELSMVLAGEIGPYLYRFQVFLPGHWDQGWTVDIEAPHELVGERLVAEHARRTHGPQYVVRLLGEVDGDTGLLAR
jgi:hypothetical protein